MNHIQFYEETINKEGYDAIDLRVFIKSFHVLEISKAKDILIDLTYFINLKHEDNLMLQGIEESK